MLRLRGAIVMDGADLQALDQVGVEFADGGAPLHLKYWVSAEEGKKRVAWRIAIAPPKSTGQRRRKGKGYTIDFSEGACSVWLDN